MAGLLPATSGLIRWSPTSTAQTLGLAVDVVRDFGASGSLATTTGSIQQGQNTLTLATPLDFQNGQGIAIHGAGEAGDPLVTTIINGGGSRFLTLAAPAATSVTDLCVEHDDSWAFQAAIDGATGPRIVTCPSGMTLKIGAPLTLRSQVILSFPSATLQWIGPDGGTLFQSDPGAPLYDAGLVGGTIDPGQAAVVASLHSPQSCCFDLTVLDGVSDLTVMAWTADAAPGGPYASSAAIGNRVDRLVAGTCGVLLSLSGAPDSPVAQNRFLSLEGRDCRAGGVVCQTSGYVQNNLFLQTLLTLNAANCVGVDLGVSDSAPAIQNLLFVDLVIANPLGTSCTGLYLHGAAQVQVFAYSHSGFPPGTPLNGGQAGSYYVRDLGDGKATPIQDLTDNWSVTPLQVGATGTPITAHLSSYQSVQLLTVPPQSGLSTSAQIKGVRPGDTVVATPSGLIPLGLAWGAGVLSDGVVTLYLSNPAMCAIPLEPMHWRFDIWQH
jgi:hypothetical protein